MPYKVTDFKAIKLKMASPEDILGWSHGEVTKPETINYRTQKPEKEGLFCEKIFGPSKDWECYCGKYKRIRYKGIICDKCGVEVTRAIVRRERMGHIKLATAVSHIWFLRGIPSKIGLVLNLSIQELEKIIYFASFIILSVDEDLRSQTLEQIKGELKSKRRALEKEFEQKINELNQKRAKGEKDFNFDKELNLIESIKTDKLESLEKAAEQAKKELRDLKPFKIISENAYQDLSLKYGHVFEAGIGAEAVRQLLERGNLKKMAKELDEEIATAIPSKKKKLIRRAKLIKSLLTNKIQPEWMVLTVLPVIPPDLRPIVQLDGGRFATSDLNDLYRRVINRNNRLKRLQELKAPEVIQRNEKRMLQEAVDALIDNSARRGKTVTASTGQKRILKSIADMLKGKQGRFRRNLLGKRVDYSGRSVIVVGPKLKMYECGLPKTMALELFRPFVISELIKRELVHNVRSANRFIETGAPEVWDVLEGIIKHAHVLLNRAPTLHRLGIQAFNPVLIEGKAIQLHPLVYTAFNADFDGDQMAVHIPISYEAQLEALLLILAPHNIMHTQNGDPIAVPSQDMVLGVYYLTKVRHEAQGEGKMFSSSDEVIIAYNSGIINLHAKIKVRINGELIETTTGRVLFNKIVPEELGFLNELLAKKRLRQIIGICFRKAGLAKTVEFLDALKDIGFKFATKGGMSVSINDVLVPIDKLVIIGQAQKKIDEIEFAYQNGVISSGERYNKIIDTWSTATNRVADKLYSELSKAQQGFNTFWMMLDSQARGSKEQIRQLAGMRGLMAKPKKSLSGSTGELIENPIIANFKEGLSILEYFISTHGARKGLADTALKTADAGYLTRRLHDVA